MTNGSFIFALAVLQHFPTMGSTAADRDHDLQPVAVGECGLRETAARHDFAVALHRHALARELQALEQERDVGVGRQTLRRAVYVDFYHFRDLCKPADSAVIAQHGIAGLSSAPGCARFVLRPGTASATEPILRQFPLQVIFASLRSTQ